MLLSSCAASRPGEAVDVFFLPSGSGHFEAAVERGIRLEGSGHGIRLRSEAVPSSAAVLDFQRAALERIEADRAYLPSLVLVMPADSEALREPLRRLARRGAVILTLDGYMGTGDYDPQGEDGYLTAHVGTDNVTAARRALSLAAAAAKHQGTVYVHTNSPDCRAAESRLYGFFGVVAEHPAMRGMGVDYGYHVYRRSYDQVLSFLRTYPEIDFAMGTNRESSAALAEALIDTGLAGTVRFISWGLEGAAREAAVRGAVDVVVDQRPEAMGRAAVAAGLKALRGNAVPRFQSVDFEVLPRSALGSYLEREFAP